MNDLFDGFDQIDRRFAKLFAAFVLLLVVGLIVADVVLAALRQPALNSPPQQPPVQEYDAGCKIMGDGTRICSMPIPKH